MRVTTESLELFQSCILVSFLVIASADFKFPLVPHRTFPMNYSTGVLNTMSSNFTMLREDLGPYLVAKTKVIDVHLIVA